MKCSLLVKPETVLVNQISVSVFSGEVHNAKQPQGESIDALKKHYDSGGAKIWGDVSGFPL